MLSLRAFMFDRVYLGPQAEPEHRRARETVEAIFERARRRRRASSCGRRPTRRSSRRLPRGNDRPLRARVRGSVVRSRRGTDQGHVRRGGQAGRGHRRRHLAPNVAQETGWPLCRPLPLPRGAHAELLGEPRPRLLLLRLRQGRRCRSLRPGDREPRLRRRDRVPRRPLPRHARVRGDLARGREGARAARAVVSSCSSTRPRTSSACSGRARRGSRYASTSRAEGYASRSRASSSSGSRRGRGSWRRRASAASPSTRPRRRGSRTPVATTTSRSG